MIVHAASLPCHSQTVPQVCRPILIDFDAAGFVVVGHGEIKDLVAQISVEGARDWRPRRAIMTRTLSEAWPERKAPAASKGKRR